MTDICPENKTWSPAARLSRGCLDFSAVHDAVTNVIVVQYCEGENEGKCTNRQITSQDMGVTWSLPLPLEPFLKDADGVLVGPGRGLQLKSNASGRAGRLLFCGHKQDPASGRLSPIWASDDHGRTYAVKAELPRGSPGATP